MGEFRLLSAGWGHELDEGVSLRPNRVYVICPFIKAKTAKRLLACGRPPALNILTRFDLRCFNDGASDIEALRLLLRAGASIRGIRGLHSKLYLFGGQRVIVTSANLTESGMSRNHEFGFVSSNPSVIAECARYFEDLWRPAGRSLSSSKLDQWQLILDKVRRARPASASFPSLPDFGAVVDLPSPFTAPVVSEQSGAHAFLKFFGTSDDRADRTDLVADIVERSECTWSCTYPPNKRPRQVKDGDTIFMGYLSNDGDLLVFGRAIGRQHRPGIDEATQEDIERRSWKADWPIYVRVHSGRFLNGRLADGVSVRRMMDELGSDTYMSTQRNAVRGTGNTAPRRAMMQKAHMQLTSQAADWLSGHLEEAFRRHGELDLTELE